MKNLTRREAVKTGAAIAAVGATATLGLPSVVEAATQDADTRTQDRRLIAAYRLMSPIMKQVFIELSGRIVNGTAPAPALWEDWCRTKLAELEAGLARGVS